MILTSNLTAQVQFISAHGGTDRIYFRKSGIKLGGYEFNTDYNVEFIGINNINYGNTILVTYTSCESAGKANIIYDNSIAVQTAVNGANVTLGFKDKIDSNSVESWTRRYNERLALGDGVKEAAQYANLFIYQDHRIQRFHLVHHGNPNQKIGKYISGFSPYYTQNTMISKKDISQPQNILKNDSRVVNSSEESIISEIKEYYPNFNKENYEISDRSSATMTNITINETEEIASYVAIQLKIGDFYTDAGYVAEIKDGIIKGIYDNNIDIKKQEELLSKQDVFKVESNKFDLDSMKEVIVENIRGKYKESKNVKIDEDTLNVKYFYDIKTDKRYILITIKSEVTINGHTGEANDSIKWEI